MDRAKRAHSVEAAVRGLRNESVRRDVPEDVAAYAASVTLRAFAGSGPEVSIDRRLRPYFSAVVRRRLARSGSSTPACARMIADSVVTDLLGAGRDASEVVAELERNWSGTLPEAVIREYRDRLCA